MRLTGVISEIADVAGEAAAAAIMERVGGTRVYIPARVGDAHWLVDAVGRRRADLICAHFAVAGRRGQHIDIPLGGVGAYAQLRRATARRIHELSQQLASASEIAKKAGVSQRTVYRHRAVHRGKPDGQQGSLF